MGLFKSKLSDVRGNRLRRGRCFLAAFVIVVCFLAVPMLGSAAAAQGSAKEGIARQDIVVRDGLIAAQENLLNTYRCLFGVDTDVVPGGCPNPDSVSPGVAPTNPTQHDVEVRDGLIRSQEALLNTYRCRFGVDTEVVPYDCATGQQVSALDRLRAQLEIEAIKWMNEIRSPATSLPVLRSDEGLSAITQAHAQAMADAQSFRAPFDFWAHLEPGWDFWSIGESASVTGDISDPQLPAELSAALLGKEGSRIPACAVCTHLATGVATAVDGTSYVTVMMAGRDTGQQLSEAEMAAAETEMAGLVNELRTSLGLDTLVYDPGVATAARRWSQIMGAGFDFNHNPYAGADYPPGYRFNGENIALNKLTTTTSDAVRQSFGDFVNSPGHYAAMVNPETTHFGVGIVLKAGWLWITQNFAVYP
ncbi:CAP domain-containing protein [Candidatus Poriferisocius sp.]|uniref:CAP domain-containing protein n=1 Tax=Candidatus Poriferisocius sp. TaxID=3101276 RepID=UPI003B01ABF1